MGLYRDETGMLIDVPDNFAEARGYTPVDPVEHAGLNMQRGEEARGEERGVIGSVNAAATGALSGLTLGLSDIALANALAPIERERVAAEVNAHPYLRTGGEVAGALIGAFANPGSLAARTPAGYLGSVAAREVEKGLAQGGVRGTAKALAVMGGEGAAQSAGQYIGHAALEDKEVTAEALSGALGTGFAFGAVGGGAVLGVTKGAMAARRLYSRVMDGPQAAKQAESAWSIASQESLDADLATARVAETKLDEIKKARLEAMRYRNETNSLVRDAKAAAAVPEMGMPLPTSGIEGPMPLADIAPAQGGMPTSVFERPAALEGPEPLIEFGPQSGGQVTSVRAPTTKKIARPEAVATAPEGDFFHGAAGDVNLAEGGHYSGKNIYGEGLYTTSERDVAASYMPKNRKQAGTGAKPRIYRASERGAVKFYDLDAPLSAEAKKHLADLAESSESAGAALDAVASGEAKTLAQALDEMRAASREVGESADTVTATIENLKDALRKDGFGGFAHTGGKLTGGKPHKVKIYWDPEVQVGLKNIDEAVATELEGQLAGTKAQLDDGVPLKSVKASKGNESDSIEGWLSEKKAFDDAELSMAKRIEDIKGASDLRMRRLDTLSDIRYKTTEDLLGPAMAKEERRLADVVDEFHEARKDFEKLMAKSEVPVVDVYGVGDGGMPVAQYDDLAAGARRAGEQTTKVGGPRSRKAVEILDDAHEEALLRAKHAADPREAGAALTEAEELENMLEGLAVPDLQPSVKGVSRTQLRSADAEKHIAELLGDVAKVERYERASAKLADELGDQAHGMSIVRAKGLRDAEKESMRKVTDRTARALDDAEMHGPMPTPKERVASARAKQSSAQSHLDELGVQEKEAAANLNVANRKVKLGEKAKKGALREDAKLAAQASKIGAQDIGGAVELLDLPGLPKPSDLPIVGPLLGAYLKFRTLKKAMGRAMGHVPATANSRVAALASRTRDRVARAVDRSLGLVERTGKFAQRPMPAVAGILAARIYDDGGEDPGKDAPITKQAAARMREIAAYVHTPGAIERDVRMQLRDVSDPDLIEAAEKHRRLMMEHLLEHAPKVPDQGILKTLNWEPSPAQSMSFARRMEALDDPAGVFERLAQERALLSLESAEALRKVYPQMFAQAQQRAIERAAEAGTKVPYRQRIQMSLFYQMPFDSALDPVNFKITQSVYDRKPSSPAFDPNAPGVAPQAPTAQPAIANPVDLSQAYTPSMDRR